MIPQVFASPLPIATAQTNQTNGTSSSQPTTSSSTSTFSTSSSSNVPRPPPTDANPSLTSIVTTSPPTMSMPTAPFDPDPWIPTTIMDEPSSLDPRGPTAQPQTSTAPSNNLAPAPPDIMPATQASPPLNTSQSQCITAVEQVHPLTMPHGRHSQCRHQPPQVHHLNSDPTTRASTGQNARLSRAFRAQQELGGRAASQPLPGFDDARDGRVSRGDSED